MKPRFSWMDRSRSATALGIGLAAGIASASAQTAINWADAGAAYTTGANWTGGVVPANDLTSNIASFNSSSPVQPNLSANRSVAGLSFGSAAGSYVLTGGAVTLTLGAAGINNAATANTQQIGAPLALGANATFTNSGGTGNLAINGGVNTAGFQLTLAGGTGSGVAQFNIAAISGTGEVVKTGAGGWRMTNVNTYTGGTTVNQGTLFVNGTGALPSGGALTINSTVASSTAVLQIGSTAGQSVGAVTFGGAGATATSANTLQINAGTVTLGGTVTYDATNNPFGSQIAGAGTLALGGNRTFNVGDSSNATFDFTVDSNVSGAGSSLTKTGAGSLSLRGANTYTGGTVVTSGRIVVSNTTGSGTGSGPVEIQSSAQLRGKGFITGATTINSGATVYPGTTNTPGTLTFSGGLALLDGASANFQLGILSSDKIVVMGGVLSGPATGSITLNFFTPSDTTASGAFGPGTYALFDFSTGGTTLSSFNVSDFVLGSTVPGYTYDLQLSGSALTVSVGASAIPEPSTYAAIFGGLALVGAIWQRKRKRAESSAAGEVK